MTGMRIVALAGMLLVSGGLWCLPGRGSPPSPAPTVGFTPTTDISITLEQTEISRLLWIASHNFENIMPGTVRITGGASTGSDGGGKVMLYGDRTDPLYSGETDWHMTPRPALLYFGAKEFQRDYTFPFGPPCGSEEGAPYVIQVYLYSACCNLSDGQSRSDSVFLNVEDGL